jgi:hypothetical protein
LSVSFGESLMSTSLNLTIDQYVRMVERGAFDHLNRKIELIRGEIREMNPAGLLIFRPSACTCLGLRKMALTPTAA